MIIKIINQIIEYLKLIIFPKENEQEDNKSMVQCIMKDWKSPKELDKLRIPRFNKHTGRYFSHSERMILYHTPDIK